MLRHGLIVKEWTMQKKVYPLITESKRSQLQVYLIASQVLILQNFFYH